MNLGHQSKRGRSSTVDALAVAPAVLVLVRRGKGIGKKKIIRRVNVMILRDLNSRLD
jgi:hypothetical protein